MSDLTDVLAGLPIEVTNQLAILEDRAIRAEQRAAHLAASLEQARTDIDVLRQVGDDLRSGCEGLLDATSRLVTEIGTLREDAESVLRHGLAVAAG